jgi:hypothetical protein
LLVEIRLRVLLENSDFFLLGYFGKKFLYPLGESMSKKSTKLEMVTVRLVDSEKSAQEFSEKI